MEISKELLEVLCCPKDKSNLGYNKEKNTLTCKDCKKTYKVENGIPILLD